MSIGAQAVADAPMLALYGIPNCDTVKKARGWLDATAVPYRFHDFKKTGVPPDALSRWIGQLGWEALLNRKGSTWRGLDETLRVGVVDQVSAERLLQAHPSLIKRPVVEWPAGEVTVGFDPDRFAEALSN